MAIVGIDPDATKDVEHKGARFTIGTVPRGIWVRLRQENYIAVDRARRRAIASCAAEGIDPESAFHTWEKDGETLSLSHLLHRTRFDPTYMEEHVSHMRDVVRWGLRAWDGVVRPDGEALPLEMETARFDGEDVSVVGRPSLKVIVRNNDLLESLYLAICEFNDMTEAEKKV